MAVRKVSAEGNVIRPAHWMTVVSPSFWIFKFSIVAPSGIANFAADDRHRQI